MDIEKEIKEIRSFAILMALILAFIAPVIILKNNWDAITVASFPKWIYVIAALFLILGTVAPMLLKPFYKGWMLLAKVLGYIVPNIIMALIFYLLFTPLAFILRRMGKDFLRLKLQPSAESYWIPKKAKFEKDSMLRQY